jgi:dihydroorotase
VGGQSGAVRIRVAAVHGLPGFDRPGAVLELDGDRIAAITGSESANDPADLTFEGAFALPGLIDFHAHVGVGLSRYAVERTGADGVVALLSQGDAGPRNVDRFVELTDPDTTRLAINVLAMGEQACGNEEVDPAGVVAAVRRWPDLIWGVSANLSRASCGTLDPRHVWKAAIEAADEAGCPILVGLREPDDWPLADQLDRMRRGDVVTYVFRSRPHNLFADPRTVDAVRAAQDRGVLFDVCHGSASFDYGVAERALSVGFAPDTISTDLSTLCPVGDPQHSLGYVIGKLIAVGMARDHALAAATFGAGRILGRDVDLRPGARADLTISRWSPPTRLRDTAGAIRTGPHLEILATVLRGRVTVAGPGGSDAP